MAASDVSVDKLRESFEIDDNGALIRVRDQYGQPISKKVGVIKATGYVSIGFMGQSHKAHRLLWALAYGEWPSGEIDHIDGNRANNTLANLRHVNRSLNQQNQRSARADSTTGLLGVCRKKDTGKFVAQIGINGKRVHIGTFPDPLSAHAAYLEAKRRLHSTCSV